MIYHQIFKVGYNQLKTLPARCFAEKWEPPFHDLEALEVQWLESQPQKRIGSPEESPPEFLDGTREQGESRWL